MAMFGLKKSKPSEGSELVLAYLEEAQRLRTPLTVSDARGREGTATLASVTEERIGLNLQAPVATEKGAALTLSFVLDGLRFKATSRIVEAKPGSTVADLPTAIALAERRKKPRARLNAREGATATALTGLFDGVGINGTIENISEGGVCIRVDRAMDVKTQRKMHLGPNLLPVGQPLMLVKLSKLPKCPVLELAGTVAYLDARQGLLIGIAFERGKEAVLAPVRALVASRTTAIPSSVPPKARRQAEPPREAEEDHQVHPAAKSAPGPTGPPVPAPDPAIAPPPHPTAATAPEASPVPPAGERIADERALALLRVKKRARGILLAMPEGSDRDQVAAFLSEDGYGRVLCAATLTELLEHLDRSGPHLILVDGGVAELQGLALASFLRQRQEDDMPPMVLAEAQVDADLVLGAQETGVAQILVKPYQPDADFARMVEEHLGLA